jgi:hypothetical protein
MSSSTPSSASVGTGRGGSDGDAPAVVTRSLLARPSRSTADDINAARSADSGSRDAARFRRSSAVAAVVKGRPPTGLPFRGGGGGGGRVPITAVGAPPGVSPLSPGDSPPASLGLAWDPVTAAAALVVAGTPLDRRALNGLSVYCRLDRVARPTGEETADAVRTACTRRANCTLRHTSTLSMPRKRRMQATSTTATSHVRARWGVLPTAATPDWNAMPAPPHRGHTEATRDGSAEPGPAWRRGSGRQGG